MFFRYPRASSLISPETAPEKAGSFDAVVRRRNSGTAPLGATQISNSESSGLALRDSGIAKVEDFLGGRLILFIRRWWLNGFTRPFTIYS